MSLRGILRSIRIRSVNFGFVTLDFEKPQEEDSVGLKATNSGAEDSVGLKATNSGSAYYCTSCNTYLPRAGKKGNGWIELVLYLFYIFPGIIYSIWRRVGNSNVCPKCKSTSVISASAGTHVKCPDCKELVLRDASKCKHCGCMLAPQ